MSPMLPKGDWLAFLGPLPAGIVPTRRPVAAPGTPGAAPDSPIAGWQSVTLDLSAPPFGLRVVLVTLDANATPISASDHVLLKWSGADQVPMIRHESLGGRIESDGSFRGTHWIFEGPEPPADADDSDNESALGPGVRRPPTAEEVARLLAIVGEVVR